MILDDWRKLQAELPDVPAVRQPGVSSTSGVHVRVKPEVMDALVAKKAVEITNYRGFQIGHSLINGKYWVTDATNHMCGFVAGISAGKQRIDDIISWERHNP